MSKSEHTLQNEIRVALSEYGLCLRLNSGKVYGGDRVWDNKRGQYILVNIRPVALCPRGTADLVFFGEDGTTALIECKDNDGRPTEHQKRFLALMESYGYRAGIARSVEDALKIIGVKKK